METERFDELARLVSTASSRRSALRGLIRGAAGGVLGVAGGAALLGEETALAKKCNGNGQCRKPNNPCKKAVCKHGKCRKKNKPNGAGCGQGRVCFNGTCGQGCKPSGQPCSGNDTCCTSVCIDTNTDFDNCGGCGDGCNETRADACVGGECVCGANPLCEAGETCCSGECFNTDTNFDNCGGCGDGCDADTADACSGGECECGGEPACTGDLVCVDGLCVVRVTPSSLDGWTIGPDGEVEFVEGPETPPLGTGSVRISTIDVTRSTIANANYAGLEIADIASLGYSTFMVNGGPTGVVVPAIKLPVRFNNDTEFTTLVFEPTYSLNSDVVVDVWQTWDALSADARWWTSRPIPGVCEDSCFVPWTDILAAVPDAFILGALLIETGSGTDDADGNVDALTINGTIFDFEPDPQ